jgi:hypothetical protein
MFTMHTQNVKECGLIAALLAEKCWVRATCASEHVRFRSGLMSFERNDGRPFLRRSARVNVLAANHFRMAAVNAFRTAALRRDW